MFYKVIKNDKVIDVLEKLVFLKYQPKHNIMVLCDKSDAQAVLSSDGDKIWHERSYYKVPVSGYETVDVVEIDEYEYRQLKMLNMKSPAEIIDEFVMSLIEEGVL